jgi:membrane protein implicated in regulation of membrane protease activity
MDDWVIWVIAAGVLAVGEIATLSFFMGPVAVAAVLAAVTAGVSDSVALQVGVFAAASLASLFVLRPIAVRHLRTPARIRTGTAALPGEPALVLEEVTQDGGQVRIGGEVWTARSFVEEEVHEKGKRVHVVSIQGATALVDD